MIGTVLKEVRAEYGWGQKVIACFASVSGSLVKEWEKGRRRITEKHKSVLAKTMDDGRFYLALARDATGGPFAPAWLDNAEEHRLVFAHAAISEMENAVAATRSALPVLMMLPDAVVDEQQEAVKNALVELASAVTMSENLSARLARLYGISLVDVWDETETRLVERGQLKPKETNKKKSRLKAAGLMISQLLSYHRR